jgi:hypothetical protein
VWACGRRLYHRSRIDVHVRVRGAG